MEDFSYRHTSVLLDEAVYGLNIKADGLYADCTLGGAGHSSCILRKLSDVGRLICIDRDEAAINNARTVLADYMDRTTLVQANFSEIDEILTGLRLGAGSMDGFLMDLGVSSHQLDEAERGFSYMHDARLDMRMDKSAELTAYDVVNDYKEETIFEIIKEYGEERWAKRIAAFIAQARKQKPIETTFELVEIIKNAVPSAARRDGPHPAKRTFQAIRIEVNNELSDLERAVKDMVNYLKPGGRVCVITFHSLEDRIIKNCFRTLESPCDCPREFPICVCGKKPLVKVVTRKPIVPSDDEIERNPRARSAKLRIAEKI